MEKSKRGTQLVRPVTFVTIVGIEDWDAYFNEMKEKLVRELKRLVLEVVEGAGE